MKNLLKNKLDIGVEFGRLKPFGYTVFIVDPTMTTKQDSYIEERMAEDLVSKLSEKIREVYSVDLDLSQFLVTGDNNWRKGFPWSKLDGATKRHKNLFNRGQDLDEESGLCHLAHAACDILMELEHYLQGYGTDDRTKDKEYEGQTDEPTTTGVAEQPAEEATTGADREAWTTAGGKYGMYNPGWAYLGFLPKREYATVLWDK